VREGGLAEGGEESASEKGWEERVPPDDGEVLSFRPFLESDGSAHINTEIEAIAGDCVLPSGFKVCSADVVDEQCYV